MVVFGYLLPIGLIVVAGLLGKAWIVWLAVVYVAVMLSVSAAIKLREVQRREQYTRFRAGPTKLMRQKLFTSVAAWSLTLCAAATVALWVRSRWHFDQVYLFPNPQRWWAITSAEGRVWVQHTRASAPYWTGRRTEFTSANLAQFYYSKGPFQWRAAGFGYGRSVFPAAAIGTTTLTAHVFQVPHAFLAAVFAAAPAAWLRGALRRRAQRARVAAGRCAACGYDLHANTSGVCPECGNPIPSPPAEPEREIY